MVPGIVDVKVLSNSPFLPFSNLLLDEYYDYFPLVVEEELALGLLACEEGEAVIFYTPIEVID